MEVISLPQIATYISYVFIIAVYSVKVAKIARMPIHLRWELYPIPHEKGYKYGGSYFEELEWWRKSRKRNYVRSALFKLRDYISFPGYFSQNRGYWFGLLPWHIGFYLIVSFHAVVFLGAFLMVTIDLPIAAASASILGRLLYYLTIIVAATSFVIGSIGSIIMLIKRVTDKDLKLYAVPINYFNYVFFLIVFLSGFVAWIAFDYSFAAYREFWVGLITFQYATVEPATYIHVMLFSLFLIYLPFTRSTHYITKLIAFFGVLWNDEPYQKGSRMEKKIIKAMGRPVSWSAYHIQSGKTWAEVAQGMPEDVPEYKAEQGGK